MRAVSVQLTCASPPCPSRNVPGIRNISAAEVHDIGNGREMFEPDEGDIVRHLDQPQLADNLLDGFGHDHLTWRGMGLSVHESSLRLGLLE